MPSHYPRLATFRNRNASPARVIQCTLIAGAVVFVGCETTNLGKMGATAAGAIGGGILGNQAANKISDEKLASIGVTKEQVKAVAMVGGAVVGGWIAGAVYSKLTDADKAGVEKATRQSASTGQSQTYTNQSTGVRARTRVVNERTETANRSIPVLKDRVQNFPPMDLIGESYMPLKDSPIWGGPGTDYKPVGQVFKDVRVHVIGRVKTEKWYVVGIGGVASGFVPTDVLKAAEASTTASVPATTPQPAPTDTVTQTVEVTTSVRTIEQVITLPDGTETVEKVTVASSPTGWEVVEPAKS